MIVVADTSPLNYLIQIEQIDLLARFFGTVAIPPAVSAELNTSGAPRQVREWIGHAPQWLVLIRPTSVPADMALELERGEQEAIALAEELGAAYLLADDGTARIVARHRGIPVIGTLGILRDAAAMKLIDLRESLANLLDTNFYASSELIERLLEEDSRRRRET
jgi:predicted nucleic acid-binding protein